MYHYFQVVPMVHWGLFVVLYVRNDLLYKLRIWFHVVYFFSDTCLFHPYILTYHVMRLIIPVVDHLHAILVILLHSCTSSVNILKYCYLFLVYIKNPHLRFSRCIEGRNCFRVIIRYLSHFAIRFYWEVLGVILLRSHLMVHPKKVSVGTADWVACYFLVYPIISISYSLSLISIIYYLLIRWQYKSRVFQYILNTSISIAMI